MTKLFLWKSSCSSLRCVNAQKIFLCDRHECTQRFPCNIQFPHAQCYHNLRNLPKARAASTSARTSANAIYCPPSLQGKCRVVQDSIEGNLFNSHGLLFWFFTLAFLKVLWISSRVFSMRRNAILRQRILIFTKPLRILTRLKVHKLWRHSSICFYAKSCWIYRMYVHLVYLVPSISYM